MEGNKVLKDLNSLTWQNFKPTIRQLLESDQFSDFFFVFFRTSGHNCTNFDFNEVKLKLVCELTNSSILNIDRQKCMLCLLHCFSFAGGGGECGDGGRTTDRPVNYISLSI